MTKTTLNLYVSLIKFAKLILILFSIVSCSNVSSSVSPISSESVTPTPTPATEVAATPSPININVPSENAAIYIGENANVRKLTVQGTCTPSAQIIWNVPTGFTISQSQCDSFGILSAEFIVLQSVSGSQRLEVSQLSGGSDEINLNIKSCPANFILVPANTNLSVSTFCVPKYEAKAFTNAGALVVDPNTTPVDPLTHYPSFQKNGLPWTKMKFSDIVSECQSMGSNYKIITNKQWQTIALNVEGVSANWDNLTPGSVAGKLFKGHTDGVVSGTAVADGWTVTGSSLLVADLDTNPYVGTGNDSSTGADQKRTLQLSNGEIAWDLAGNAKEWVDIDGLSSSLSYTGVASSGYYEYNSAQFSSMIATSALSQGGSLQASDFQPFYSSLTAAANNIGRMYIQSNGSARTGKGISRGGHFSASHQNGIFGADLDLALDSATSSSTSFRCVYNP